MDADRFNKRLSDLETGHTELRTIVSDHLETCERDRKDTKALLQRQGSDLQEIKSVVSRVRGIWAAICFIAVFVMQLLTLAASVMFR